MGPCIIAGMDTNKNVFAAFCNESLRQNCTEFYGSGQCWVAKVHPNFQVYNWQPGRPLECVLATESFLAFGGGGAFALWLDGNFDRGTSEASGAFGNPGPLCSSEVFKCVTVEIWGFASPSLSSSLSRSAFKTVSTVVSKITSKGSAGNADV